MVLLPGDLTWAMRLEDAMEDIARVGGLPGRKLILRGNHDYWWSAIGRVRRALPEGMYALQNDSLELDGVLYAGSRGWTLPPYAQDEDDKRIYERERLRLEMSLKHARSRSKGAPLVVMTHYPPLTEACEGVSDLLEAYGACACIYGHLHGAALSGAFRGVRNGITTTRPSCDGLGFKLFTYRWTAHGKAALRRQKCFPCQSVGSILAFPCSPAPGRPHYRQVGSQYGASVFFVAKCM